MDFSQLLAECGRAVAGFHTCKWHSKIFKSTTSEADGADVRIMDVRINAIPKEWMTATTSEKAGMIAASGEDSVSASTGARHLLDSQDKASWAAYEAYATDDRASALEREAFHQIKCKMSRWRSG